MFGGQEILMLIIKDVLIGHLILIGFQQENIDIEQNIIQTAVEQNILVLQTIRMNKRYLTCLILIILYFLRFILEWIIYKRIYTFSLGMIIITLIIMCIVYYTSKSKKEE